MIVDGGKGHYEGEAGDAKPRTLDSNRLAETVLHVHATPLESGAGYPAVPAVGLAGRVVQTFRVPNGPRSKVKGILTLYHARPGAGCATTPMPSRRQGSHGGQGANVSLNTLMLPYFARRVDLDAMAVRATAGLHGPRLKADARRRAHPKLSPQAYGRIIPKSVKIFAGNQKTGSAV